MVHLSEKGRGNGITYKSAEMKLTSDVAELLGFHAGDGWISCGVWGVRSAIQDENLTRRIVFLARDVLGVEPCVRIRENTYEIRSGQKQAVQFFYNYGFAEGKKAYRVCVPSRIMKTDSVEIIRAFLRGLFSSDGSFSFQKRDRSCRVDLTIRSKSLRDEFVELSARVGFSFNTCDPIRVKKGFTNKSAGAFFNANLTSKTRVLEWMTVVGTHCDTHLKKLRVWQEKQSSA